MLEEQTTKKYLGIHMYFNIYHKELKSLFRKKYFDRVKAILKTELYSMQKESILLLIAGDISDGKTTLFTFLPVLEAIEFNQQKK